MMTKRMKHLGLIMVLSCLGFCLSAGGTIFAADPPKPGTVIDKNNCMHYKEYFPEIWMEIFTNGWDIIPPLSIKILESKPNPIPEKFLVYSEKNKGKYGLDADGHITGGPYEEIVGFPFPGVNPVTRILPLRSCEIMITVTWAMMRIIINIPISVGERAKKLPFRM